MQGLTLPTWATLSLYWLATLLTHLILTDPNPPKPSIAPEESSIPPAKSTEKPSSPSTNTTPPPSKPTAPPHEPLLVRLCTNHHVLAFFRLTVLTLPALHLTLLHYLHTSYPPSPGHVTTHTTPLLDLLCPYYSYTIDTPTGPTFLNYLPPLTLLGLALKFLSAPLRLLCFAQLGKSFTFGLTPPHSGLVKTGLYKYVRHPSYTFVYLAMVGYLLTFAAPGGVGMRCFFGKGGEEVVGEWGWGQVLMLGMGVGFLGIAEMFRERMEGEERFLEGLFGEEWREYKRRTWKLVPGFY